MISPAEEPLPGGRTTLAVVKIGNTVRRTNPNPNPMAGPLLLFLEQRGFHGTPRFLGMDEKGREMLSYIPGHVPWEGLIHHEDDDLVAAARLLRAFHDVTAEFPGRNSAEVICHHDFSPGNCVYVDGRPTAMIDFDLAAPGTRLWDLGYTVPTFLNMGHPDYEPETQMHRMRLFADAYGLPQDKLHDLVVNIIASLASCACWAHDIACQDISEWASSRRDWVVAHLLDTMISSRRGRISHVSAIPDPSREADPGYAWDRLMRS